MKKMQLFVILLSCFLMFGGITGAFADDTVSGEEMRDDLYLYHPRSLVLENEAAEVAFWHSSDNAVIRVDSDGVVVACKEGKADVTAYAKDGTPIQTFLLCATTVADADPFGTSYCSVNAYKDICYENVKEEINTITDYACWLYANDVFYSMDQEASNPMYQYAGDAYWMQMADSSWIFKNRAGICCTVAAGGQYALQGDYEENGLIYMAGPKGHVISYFKENGEYLVVDFTCNISDGRNVINEQYCGDVLEYTKHMTGKGKTLKEAFANYMQEGRGSFYLENYIIYAMDLTGLDDYPAEANNWSRGKDFSVGTNILYVVEGTELETLYVKDGIKFQVTYMKREAIPGVMQVVTEADAAMLEEILLLGAVPKLRASVFTKTDRTMLVPKELNYVSTKKQQDLLSYIDYSGEENETLKLLKRMGRSVLFLGETNQLEVPENTEYFVSTDANIIRVSGNGIVTGYSEGVADVYACDKEGNVLKTYTLYTTTKAEVLGALEQSIVKVEDYSKISYEDIPERLNTITDVVCWMYANNAFYEGYREPKSPMTVMRNYIGDGNLQWMQMANSNWMFKDLSGICCNMAAAAQYALAGDYEENGLIFMSGRYGHVINYFRENDVYYIFDYTTAAGGHSIRNEYGGDVEGFVKEKAGIGITLQEALSDYIKRGSGNFYYENFVIYSMDLTGLNYYPAECNNWCNDSLEKVYQRVNRLYVMEGTQIEVLYLEQGVQFETVELKRDEIPAYMEVVLTERVK